MDELDLLFDLHRRNPRQGPGSRAATLRAIELAGLTPDRPLRIADLGCGTGASARVLAEVLDAWVTAVDFGQPFLDELERHARDEGVADRIETVKASIDDLRADDGRFRDGRFDVLWSEGAIYNLGFERGVRDWRRLLKPGGVLVVSEITWTTSSRPDDLQVFWDEVYPEIDLASAKIGVLEQAGYSPIGYFTLPPECWLEGYYRPLEKGFDAFLERHGNSPAARGIVQREHEEIERYRRCGAHYSYGMYIARRLEAPAPR
ncbi:methyltransferase domain-containing protein [Wenzhouxiangella sp. XN79A]|uniref:class I SAM-dependent methyltransferase n=1 Tax=Wenzhouxiangella sp. XN79A TaxID=2724193 RepID=UPI00144A54A5|nr:class I SAM-dependent methyltransferase [Wenzhouxiangella sp. XN79A]NKI35573.1 methyltransferase domain-containing protein [Wenzhouxiangella sp. XN79A]